MAKRDVIITRRPGKRSRKKKELKVNRPARKREPAPEPEPVPEPPEAPAPPEPQVQEIVAAEEPVPVRTARPSTSRKKIARPPVRVIKKKKRGGESLYHELLESVYDAVVITDLAGRICEVNHRAVEFLRFELRELKSMHIFSLIMGADDSLLDTIRQNVDDERFTLAEATCERKDGTRFPAEIAINLIHISKRGELCFFIRDVSLRKEAEDALLKANSELIRAEKMKGRLDTITTLSHEINNPLQMLLSMVELEGNHRYKAPLDRIISVLRELRKQEDLETVHYAGGMERYKLSEEKLLMTCTPARILIADDEKPLRDMFGEAIGTDIEEVKIDYAANGEEALSLFSDAHHAVIVLDVVMPKMNGEQTFQELEKLCHERQWEMPAVIFCTAFAPPRLIQESIGGNSRHCYLPKPISRKELVDTVRERL